MSELLLGVNIDHVATLRQARGTRYPDPVHAALQIEQAGAVSVKHSQLGVIALVSGGNAQTFV